MFYQSVTASVLFYAIVCWGGSTNKRNWAAGQVRKESWLCCWHWARGHNINSREMNTEQDAGSPGQWPPPTTQHLTDRRASTGTDFCHWHALQTGWRDPLSPGRSGCSMPNKRGGENWIFQHESLSAPNVTSLCLLSSLQAILALHTTLTFTPVDGNNF